MDSEERAVRATHALNALQYLITTTEDLGGLIPSELGWLMDVVFSEAKAAMPGRGVRPGPMNDDYSPEDLRCP